jgi:hypothetical protein
VFENLIAVARRYWPAVIPLVLAFAGITYALVDTDADGKPDRLTITIERFTTPAPAAIVVDTADRDRQRDNVIELTPRAQRAYRSLTSTEYRGELAEPLRDPGDRGPVGVLEGPLAAQEFPGCRTRFVGNYSSRNGTRPQIIVWHQTVSRERGTASQDALTAYANRRSSGVSWHLLIGRTNGLCTFSVPLTMKAWTQGNANPFSIGIEVEAFGDEPTYVAGLGERKLLAVTRELGRRYGIPMRKGLVQNCRVVRSGVVEHSDLGACGGGHADVTPWSTDALLEQLKAPATLASTERRRCNALRYHRRKVKSGTGYWTPSRVRRVRYLKGALAAAGVDPGTCR